jgi:hypothetical protein
MDDRAFDDFETTIEAGGRAVPVRVIGNALHGIWGAGVAPQIAQAILDENRPLVGWFGGVLTSKYALVRRRDGAFAFNVVGAIRLGFAVGLALPGLRAAW